MYSQVKYNKSTEKQNIALQLNILINETPHPHFISAGYAFIHTIL